MSKGVKGFQKGYKQTEEAKRKIGLASRIRKSMLGKHHTEETKKRMSEKAKGRSLSLEIRKKISEKRKKYFLKHPEYKQIISVKGKHWKIKDTSKMRGRKGILCPNWKGGISKISYPYEFNNSLKEKIRQKYHYICQRCGMTEIESLIRYKRKLCVNHIDFNKQNCLENNLNTLCIGCNVKINNQRELYTAYFKDIEKIGNFLEYGYN